MLKFLLGVFLGVYFSLFLYALFNVSKDYDEKEGKCE